MIKYEGKESKAVGCVYDLGEHNGYNDSDFYACYLNLETGETEYEEYNTTRFAGGGHATIDLTFENLNKWWEKAKSLVEIAFKKSLLDEASLVTKGKRVVVTKGRKVPHGIKGKVFYLKSVNYDPWGRDYNTEIKIGIEGDDDNIYWTYAKNVEVINPSEYVPQDALEEKMKNYYKRYWDIAFDVGEYNTKMSYEECRKQFWKF